MTEDMWVVALLVVGALGGVWLGHYYLQDLKAAPEVGDYIRVGLMFLGAVFLSLIWVPVAAILAVCWALGRTVALLTRRWQ